MPKVKRTVQKPLKTVKTTFAANNFNANDFVRKLPIGWNFGSVEWEHPKFHCTYKDFLKHSKKIIDSFEGKTLSEIENSSAHSHAWQGTDKLDKEFLKIIESKKLEQEQLFQLHLTGKRRLFGYITYNIFHVIAFDHDHTVYKVTKRHT